METERDRFDRQINWVWTWFLRMVWLPTIPFFISIPLVGLEVAPGKFLMGAAMIGWAIAFLLGMAASLARRRYVAEYGWPEE